MINITPEKYRCTFGACPAVYRFDSDDFYGIIGKVVNDPDFAGRIGEGEAAVEISADLLLASLGVTALIEAAEPIAEYANKYPHEANENIMLGVPLSDLRALCSALNAIKGGGNADQ